MLTLSYRRYSTTVLVAVQVLATVCSISVTLLWLALLAIMTLKAITAAGSSCAVQLCAMIC
jgi:hypothetical protein